MGGTSWRLGPFFSKQPVNKFRGSTGGTCAVRALFCNFKGFPKKLRPALGGELAARDPVWDGEGWGCDRVAGPVISLLSVVAGAGGGERRAAVAKGDPYVRIALRLTLDEAVAGLGPGYDVLVLVVENELSLVSLHGQHR